MKIGNLVRFAHEQNGGPVHRVASVMSDGMVELHDMVGYFAPHLFVVADDVADIPPSDLSEAYHMDSYGLSPEERLIWLLGDMMSAAENFYGAPNPKREGHIYCTAKRIIDEVLEPAIATRCAELQAKRSQPREETR